MILKANSPFVMTCPDGCYSNISGHDLDLHTAWLDTMIYYPKEGIAMYQHKSNHQVRLFIRKEDLVY